MQSFENFKKSATKKAYEKIYSWKQEHSGVYSLFNMDIMKIMHNDFSFIERIFKMAVKYIPVPVLSECKKLFEKTGESNISNDEYETKVSRVVDDIMALKGYITIGLTTEEIDGTTFLVREFGISEEDRSDIDDERIYLPLETEEEFWESLPSYIQLAIFSLGKGRSAEELSELVQKVLLTASYTLPKMFSQIQGDIIEGRNALLMCTLYYIMYDHGFTKLALALSKISLNAKQVSYVRDGIKMTIDKAIETSISEAYDKKSEWAKVQKELEDPELQRVIANTLAVTKGKHGRPHVQQETFDFDDYLIGDKSAIKKEIMNILADIGYDYDIAFLKEALYRSKHMKEISFPRFYRAICELADKKYEYDRAQRMDSLINYNRREFESSKKSRILRGRNQLKIMRDRLSSIH